LKHVLARSSPTTVASTISPLSKPFLRFIGEVEARPNSYQAEAAPMAAQNVSRVRKGFDWSETTSDTRRLID
jgi:hypothetical protein